MQPLQLDARTPPDVEAAFAKAREAGAQGLFQAVDSFMNSQRAVLARLAAQDKLPMIFTDREYVLAGGLMSIGPGHQEGYQGAASYVDKILRGANPADLPVAPTKKVDFTISRAALARSGLNPAQERQRPGERLGRLADLFYRIAVAANDRIGSRNEPAHAVPRNVGQCQYRTPLNLTEGRRDRARSGRWIAQCPFQRPSGGQARAIFRSPGMTYRSARNPCGSRNTSHLAASQSPPRRKIRPDRDLPREH